MEGVVVPEEVAVEVVVVVGVVEVVVVVVLVVVVVTGVTEGVDSELVEVEEGVTATEKSHNKQ